MNKPTTVYSSLCNDTEEMEHLLLGIGNNNNDEADGPGPPPQSSGRTSDSDRQKRSTVAGRFEKAQEIALNPLEILRRSTAPKLYTSIEDVDDEGEQFV